MACFANNSCLFYIIFIGIYYPGAILELLKLVVTFIGYINLFRLYNLTTGMLRVALMQ